MDEPDVSDLLTVARAIEIIDAADVAPRAIELALAEADGLRLARDVVADRDYPPFDKSLMDGFAVRRADVARLPAELNVAGEIAAGQHAARGLAPGETMAIMTGAPLPDGADGVVPIEDVERLGERVRVLSTTNPGRFVAKQGADVKAGAILLKTGAKLGPAQLAVAASVGASRVRVFAKPRAAVLATGDEIIPIDATPQRAQIRNSNSVMLASLLRRLDCDVTDLGVARDRPDDVRAALKRGLDADVLFVSGGMSMGEYDYVPRTLVEMGLDLRITKLRIKPGKPFVFAASADGKYVFGLPGNPVSGFVCTIRLAARLLARLSGGSPEPRWISAPLTKPLAANGPREFYQPAVLDDAGVHPLEWKGSADVFTLAGANVLLVRPENDPARPAGDVVRVLEVPS